MLVKKGKTYLRQKKIKIKQIYNEILTLNPFTFPKVIRHTTEYI